MSPEPQKLATYPHCLTRPGTMVELYNEAGTFTVRGGFVAYQDGKRRNVHILQDGQGALWAAINGWLTPFAWISERLGQLQAAAREEAELRLALRVAFGEE